MTNPQEGGAGPDPAQAAPVRLNRPPGAVTTEAVTWAFRMFLGREPTGQAEIGIHLPHVSIENLRRAFAESREFQEFYDTVAKRRKPRFGAAPFLLRPPAEGVPWRFEPPTLDQPVSQLCTAAQYKEPAFAEIAQAMAIMPRLHRKVWEHVYVVSVLATFGCIGPGKSAIGFGVGKERIASLLASRGVEVLATDLPAKDPGQRKPDALHLFYPEILPLADFERLVRFLPVDVLDPPEDLGGPYDAVWSCGLAQHLGSVATATGFVEASLGLLKPGGVAVHAFDFNIASDEDTIEAPDLSVPRRSDLEALFAHLAAQGHQVSPLNLHPGHETADGIVDIRPYGLPHLKIEVGEHIVTSIGVAVRRGG